MNRRSIGVLMLLVGLFLTGEVSADENKGMGMKILETKKIYFGHQSVGGNIINGIKEILKSDPMAGLKIVDYQNGMSLEGAAFYHSRIGRNTNPKSKIDAFSDVMEKSIGNKADAALMKLCFIDFTKDTNVRELFEYYRNKMEILKQRYPNTKIVHVTAPLVIYEGGVKSMIKKIIGRPLSGHEDNVRRNEFNELMRAQYKGKDPLFDLAEIESISPDGKRSTFAYNGREYASLSLEYTDDGDHLNKSGGKRVAGELLTYLASLMKD